ncbi:PEGA domain-containing protein [Methanococcus maripaludis]|uniref:PEGA domain-containing protein n=2 Tax=Methanococcus maripaludis TaxID=39152 RepID=A0A7J9PJT4_METMI|nr:PEGA domain-containing protein [Methanococcus maripaludis]MBA2862940.1 hypothetical protein [Methanococcus maripaludis]
MIKRYILFLLLLLCVSTVNAGTTTISSSDQTSDYYVILNNPYTDELLLSALNTTSWSHYIPVVVGYGDNKVYFSSEKDLARFCTVLAYNNKVLPFSGEYVAYIGDQPATVTTYYSTSTTTRTGYVENAQYAYIYAVAYTGGDYYGSESYVYFNSESLAHTEGKNAVSGQFTSRAVSGTYDHRVCCAGYQGYGFYSVTIFDYVDYDDTLVTTLIEPPDQGTVSINTEPETAVYDGDILLGTTDNGGLLEIDIPIGEYNLKLVKEGYWDAYEYINVNIENETELFVSLSPNSAIFQVSKEFSEEIYPNSVGTLSMDVSPVKDAYATKLRVSGVEVNKVYYHTQEIPKAADGSYILGDITNTQNLEIEFKTPSSWGQKTFTVELSAVDIEGTAYTNLETINYEVLELPFLLEMPETFGIGTNDITVTDMSGTAYSVLLVLYDSEDVEQWSSSTSLLEYCDYTFEVPIDDADDYTIELIAKAGTVKTYYSIEIIEPVTLITEEITANSGNVATVQFKISNPTSNVKYYTAELTCPFYNESIAKTFSIAPETVDKTVDISFEVPEELELENYQLSLEIFDPDKTDAIYSGNVVLTISESSLFLASVPGGNTTLILLAAAVLLIAGTFAALRLKK